MTFVLTKRNNLKFKNMSLIKSITGVAKDTVTFRKNVSAIEIQIERLAGAAIDIVTPNIEMYIVNTKKSKRVTFCPRVRMIDLAELSTTNRERVIICEGQAVLSAGAVAALGDIPQLTMAPKIQNCYMQIDLTDGVNGVEINGDDDIVIELSELDLTTKYVLRAVEEDDVDNAHKGFELGEVVAYKYEVLSTKQEQNARFTTKGIQRFAIDRTAAFESVEIGFKDGSNKKLTVEDIDGQARDTFGKVYHTEYNFAPDLGSVKLTHDELIPRSNVVIPVDEDMTYLQVNSVMVGGVYVAVRVIAQSEQVVGKDVK